MADILKTGIAALGQWLKNFAAQPITYSRATDSVDLLASYGSKLLKIDDGMGGIRIEWTDVTTPSPEGDGFLEEAPLDLEPVSRRCPPPAPSGPSAFAGNVSSASRRVEKATPESVKLMPDAALRGAGDSPTVPGFSSVGNECFDLSTLESGDSPVA